MPIAGTILQDNLSQARITDMAVSRQSEPNQIGVKGLFKSVQRVDNDNVSQMAGGNNNMGEHMLQRSIDQQISSMQDLSAQKNQTQQTRNLASQSEIPDYKPLGKPPKSNGSRYSIASSQVSRSSKAKLLDNSGAAAEPYGTQQRTIEAVTSTSKVLDSGAGPAGPEAAPAYNSFNPYENAAAEERQNNTRDEEVYTPATEEKDTPAFEGAVKR